MLSLPIDDEHRNDSPTVRSKLALVGRPLLDIALFEANLPLRHPGPRPVARFA